MHSFFPWIIFLRSNLANNVIFIWCNLEETATNGQEFVTLTGLSLSVHADEAIQKHPHSVITTSWILRLLMDSPPAAKNCFFSDSYFFFSSFLLFANVLMFLCAVFGCLTWQEQASGAKAWSTSFSRYCIVCNFQSSNLSLL